MRNGPYELVIAPVDYPGKRYRGKYIYEHHLIWWQNTGQVVPEGYLVHHKNEQKRDNRFENLVLKGWAEHTRDHCKPAEMVDMVCRYCGTTFSTHARNVRHKTKLGQTNFYCSKSHQVKQMWKDGIKIGRSAKGKPTDCYSV